jgi:hypothetical protein
MRTLIQEDLSSSQISSRGLARALVGHDFKGDFLAFLKSAQTGTFHRRNMDEYVLAFVVRLNEAKLF